MQQNIEEQHEEKELICRKCNAVYIFLGMISAIVLLMMFLCLFSLDLGTMGNSSLLQFFLLVELIIAIIVLEEYVNILVIGKDGIRFESGIIVKNKKEIPYDKINSINIHSFFGLGHLEIKTGNEEMTRYKFLNKYEEVENIIKERINKNKK